ncbi:MAG: hypothetical protein IKO72_05160 [Kiritimatiellae bacterium]|nr:hypothetical protein [Kiritimatiellia bacterium]
MFRLLDKLHARLGDFWWYSLMLFCACRIADVLNALVGLWLVPKYVGPSELGAVMPLTQFANFLALPAAAFANTFRNELTRLSVSREFGKLKTLMRGVFIATAAFLILAIVVARFTLPLFLERIRIVEGSLGLIIIAASFISAACPVYSFALQALKKFKAHAILSAIGAPIRFVTMLLAMPFRALSGYFIGQAATPAFTMVGDVLCLRKELAVPAEPYWDRSVFKRFLILFVIFAGWSATGGISGLVESTVLRQRLPDLDSAGYYMATRFSEIAGYFFCTVSFTIFPYTADMAAEGKDMRPLILKASLASIAFGALVALPFFFIAKPILAILPHGTEYAAYWWVIPWCIGITALTFPFSFYTTAEVSAQKFDFLKWLIPFDLAYPVLLLLVTGHGHLAGFIPTSWTEFLTAHNIYSLETMLLWMTGANAMKLFFCLAAMANAKPTSK